MKTIDFSQLGGLHIYQDSLEFMQTGYFGAFAAFAAGLGDKLIINGVHDLGSTISDGWVVISGELMPFVGGPKSPQVIIDDLLESESFDDGSIRPVYLTRRAKMGSVGGFAFSELRRFKSDALNLNDSDVLASARAIKQLNDNLLSVISFETEVILKGCEVSNVDTVAQTLQIAAGVALVNNSIVPVPAYAGAYPAYFSAIDLVWSDQEPGQGAFLYFWPYTHHYYRDVLKRATTPIGEIKMFKTLSDRFDSNGYGQYEMLGFRICDDLQGRVPLGYDRRQSDPGDDVWDYFYQFPGQPGGVKKHQLAIDEMPKHKHKTFYLNKGNPGDGNSTLGTGTSASFVDTTEVGGDQPHENRQPYRVVVFAERI